MSSSLNFHSLIDGARLARARSLPDSHFHSLTLNGESGRIVAFALFTDGRWGGYLVHVDQLRKTITHECPDWIDRQSSGGRLCKHVAKFFMLLPPDRAKELLDDIAEGEWDFVGDPRAAARLRKQIQEEAFERLLEEGRIREAVSALVSAAQAAGGQTLYEERLRNALVTAALRLSPSAALQFGTEVLALQPPPPHVVFVGFHHALLTGIESLADRKDLLPALADADAIERIARYGGRVLRNPVQHEAERQFARAEDLTAKVALATLLFGTSPHATPQQLFPAADEIQAARAFAQRRLETAMIRFAEQRDVDLLVRALQRLGVSSLPLHRRQARYQEELQRIRQDLLTRRARWLLRFAHERRLLGGQGRAAAPAKVRLGVRHDSYGAERETEKMLLDVRHSKLNPAEQFLLDACGLEGRGNYITAHDFVRHYPVWQEIAECDLFQEAAWNEEGKRLKKLVVAQWGSLNPRLSPTPPRENDAPEQQRAPSYPDSLIVEWELASEPIRGSLLKAVHEGATLIPLPSAKLTAALEPLDLTLCAREPVEAQGSLRLLHPRRRLALEEAIHAIERGALVVSRFRPLVALWRALHSREAGLFDIEQAIARCGDAAFIEDMTPLVKALERARTAFLRRQREKQFAAFKAGEVMPSDDDLRALLLVDGLQHIAENAPGLLTPLLLREALKTVATLEEALAYLVHRIGDPLLRLVRIESPLRPFPIETLAQTRLRFLVPQIVEQRLRALREAAVTAKKGKYDIAALKRTVYGQTILRQLNLARRRYLSAEEWERVERLRSQLLDRHR